MPSASSGPVPGSPKFGICGSSCICRPIPWPTRARITENPSASTRRWTAAETSPNRLPGRHCSTASKRASRVVARSRPATAVTFPIGTVMAASATQPSRITPTSSDRMSPRESLYGPGIPCTTMELGEAQIDPGNPR